jgi:hypothetical protein
MFDFLIGAGTIGALVFLAGYVFGKVSGRAECRRKHYEDFEEKDA